MHEEWRPVVGFEGVYSVSNRNRVRREPGYTRHRRWRVGGVLKPRKNKYGYTKYTLYRDGEPRYVVLHRLVAEAFLGPSPEGKPLVLHKDDNPENNTPENLYWGDLADNQRDVLMNGNNFGRNKAECVHGHEYTPENTYITPRTGHRSCRTCRQKSIADYNQRMREKKND